MAMQNEKKLVLVSTVIHGVRRSKFVMIELIDEKVRIPENDLPGLAGLPRGTTYTPA